MGSGKGQAKRVRSVTSPISPIDAITVSQETAHKQYKLMLKEAVMPEGWREAEWIEASLKETYDWFDTHGERLGSGLTRTAFRMPDGIIAKIPNHVGVPTALEGDLNERLQANAFEYALTQQEFKKVKTAKTNLVWHKNGLPILLQEEVNEHIPENELPDWSMLIEGQQVGRNKAGDIVAYDMDAGVYDVPVGVEDGTPFLVWANELDLPMPSLRD